MLRKPRRDIRKNARLSVRSKVLVPGFVLGLASQAVALAQTPPPAPTAQVPSHAAAPLNNATSPVTPAVPTDVKVPTDAVISARLRVRQMGNGTPLRRVELTIGRTKFYTDAKGNVTLRLPRVGDGLVRVFRSGFEATELPFSFFRNRKAGDDVPEIYLVESVDGASNRTVVIQGQNDNGTSRKTLGVDEASKLAPGGDPAQIVKLMPGVQIEKGGRGGGQGAGPGGGRGGGFGGRGGGGGQVGGRPLPPPTAPTTGGAPAPGGPGGGNAQGARPASNANAGIIIRGSAPAASRYFVDDLEVPFVFHSIEDLSVVPGMLLNDVQFQSGGFTSHDGNAMGGIVRLDTKSDFPTQGTTEAILNVPFYSGVYNRTPLSDTSVLSTSFRRSYVDFFAKQYYDQITSKNGIGAQTQTPTAMDAHVMYTQKTETGLRKITLIGGQDGNKTIFSNRFSAGSDTSVTSNSTDEFAVLGYEQQARLSDNWSLRTTPQVIYSVISDQTGDTNSASTTQWKARAPTETIRSLAAGENLALGLDPDIAVITDKNTSGGGNPFFQSTAAPTTVQNTYHVGNVATWLAVDQRFGLFTVTPSARVFYNSEIKRTSADPRLNVSYEVTKSNTLKASAGQYSMAPTYSQASGTTGNPTLFFQHDEQAVVGIETRWTESWKTDIEGYHKQGYNLVRPGGRVRETNNGRDQSNGVEVFVQKNMSDRLFGFATYTLSRTLEKANSQSPWVRSAYDQSQVINLAVDYRLTATWDIAGRYRFNTGNTYTPVAGATYDATQDRYQQLTSGQNANNLPAVQSFSVYVTKEILFDTWKLSVRAGLEEFWFKPQIDGYNPNYDFTKEIPHQSLNTIPFLEFRGVL